MAARMPTLAELGFNDPRVTTPLPQYSASDPGTAALGNLGAGLQQVGGAALRVAQRQEDDRQALNAATATTDMVTRLFDLHAKAYQTTDPAELADIKQQIGAVLPTSANAIDDPKLRALWLSRHSDAVLQAQFDIDKKVYDTRRKNYLVGLETQLDEAQRKGTATGDLAAVEAALLAGTDQIEKASAAGIDPQVLYQLRKQFEGKAVTGAVGNFIDQGNFSAANALLERHVDAVDAPTREMLKARIEAKADPQIALGAVNQALGRAPMSVGGAIPRRIADEAAAQNVDPTMALATAQIESGMGQNLGSRGNIFQLGQSEWASVGGGRMGEPQTDIRNGIGFLAKTQVELRDKLGREPQPWEIYLAHQQGVGGATALLGNPGKPAGEVVPAQNISANGGDPNAPASTFVAKWRDRFSQTSAGIRGTLTPPAGGETVAVGDSIAAHMIRKAGAGGRESGKVGIFNGGDTAVSGYTPTQILDAVIPAIPDSQIRGKNIVLSTGASNDPSQTDEVPRRIAALKQRGAASVTLMGVGTADKLAGVNDTLAQLANDNGATFAGPLRNPAGDKIHSSDPAAEFAAARRAIPTKPTLPLTRGQQVLTTLPDYLTARAAIEANPGLSDKQRKMSLDMLNSQFHQETTLYHSMDSAAKQMLSDRQTANQAEILGRVIQGQSVDQATLGQLVQTQQITPEAYRAVISEQNRTGRGQDDLSVFNDLDRRARAGEDVSNDIAAAVEQGKLRGTTALSLQRAADGRAARRGDQIERSAFSTLRTVAGGDAVEKGLINFGNEAQVRQVQLWAQAQQEWNRRVLVDREDPMAVLGDMIPRYGHPVRDIGALPTPRVGRIEKIEDIAPAVAKTQDARDKGTMTEAQFYDELRLLRQYQEILEENNRRKDAAAASSASPIKGGRIQMK